MGLRVLTFCLFFKEQKISDIGNCLCDILSTMEPHQLVGAVDSITNLLHGFMCLLANFRNRESGYLAPLADRATALLVKKTSPMAIAASPEHGYDVEGISEGIWSRWDYTSSYLGG